MTNFYANRTLLNAIVLIKTIPLYPLYNNKNDLVLFLFKY